MTISRSAWPEHVSGEAIEVLLVRLGRELRDAFTLGRCIEHLAPAYQGLTALVREGDRHLEPWAGFVPEDDALGPCHLDEDTLVLEAGAVRSMHNEAPAPAWARSNSWNVLVNSFGPHHLANCSGSLKASQTRWRGASITREVARVQSSRGALPVDDRSTMCSLRYAGNGAPKGSSGSRRPLAKNDTV